MCDNGKIGILTFHRAINYGAVIQAFALQKWLQFNGYNPKIIDYHPPYLKTLKPMNISDLLSSSALSFKYLKDVVRFIRNTILIYPDYLKKIQRFNLFVEANLNLEKVPFNYNSNKEYLSMLYGSDQIWNPEITNGFDGSYFGKLFSSSTKNIAYAASVGDITVLQDKVIRKQFGDLLSNFSGISCRENTLARFINDEFNLPATYVLDPTLLINPLSYKTILDTVSPYRDSYVLLYQLERYPEGRIIAEAIAKKRKLKIIELCGTLYNKPHLSNVICDAGPAEALRLIYDADFIVTNSYHGITLSIEFKKDFLVFLSRKRNSRIIELLSVLGLESRISTTKLAAGFDLSIDYFHPYKALESMKNVSKQYLISELDN